MLRDPRLNAAEKARLRADLDGQHREPRRVDAAACPFHHGGVAATQNLP